MAAKIALVTGGAQGIGLACGRALAADGYRVMLADIRDSVMEAAEGIGGRGFVCDVADLSALMALFDAIEARWLLVRALLGLDEDLRAYHRVPDPLATRRERAERLAGRPRRPTCNRWRSTIRSLMKPPSSMAGAMVK